MTRGAHKTVPNPAFWSGYIDCDGCRLLPDAKAGRRSGQCLARASATHLLIALCCAHKDISLYFACSFTSPRQVAVACFTAALSGWSAAIAKVGSKRKLYATSIASDPDINVCPYSSAPVTAFATLCDTRTITPPSCAIASKTRWMRKFSAPASSRRSSTSSSPGDRPRGSLLCRYA
jgi:hypothetical protein